MKSSQLHAGLAARVRPILHACWKSFSPVLKQTQQRGTSSAGSMQLRHDGLMDLDRGAAVAVLEKLLEFLALAGSKQPWSSDAQRVTRSSGQAVLEVGALAWATVQGLGFEGSRFRV